MVYMWLYGSLTVALTLMLVASIVAWHFSRTSVALKMHSIERGKIDS